MYFSVLLNGENFWLDVEGAPTRMGFFTRRYVVAENEEEAENLAVKMLREDPKFESILNDKSDPPMIFCEGVENVQPFDPGTVVQTGYAFYKQE
jgi:hypothetical protein